MAVHYGFPIHPINSFRFHKVDRPIVFNMNTKRCIVPSCSNTNHNSSKTFIYINNKLAPKWCRSVGVQHSPNKKRGYYCCEDHLELKEAIQNYYYWKMMGARPILNENYIISFDKENVSLNEVSSHESLSSHQQVQDLPKSEASELRRILLEPNNILTLQYKYVSKTDNTLTHGNQSGTITSKHVQPGTPTKASMDLPPDKAKLLRNYDLEKKWELICDQDMVQAKGSPAHYLNKLKTYLDPTASRSIRKRKMVGDSTSTQVLKDLEISLRTNNIEWVQEFLNEENQGLDVLIDYLSYRLSMMRHEQRLMTLARCSSDEGVNHAKTCEVNEVNDGSEEDTARKRTRHAAKLNMGASKNDIHNCILCMRAIMNNKYGFNMVIQHREAINSIALSLNHHSQRTKALVLELLAAICLVNGGHQITLSAFDNFKEVVGEPSRFHTLMQYFKNYEMEDATIDFMVACMQFVNVIVHSVEDMNFRVHLQYEFTALHLDHYLDKLRNWESDDLQVQISAYLDNMFDVAALVEDSETKTSALEEVNKLEDRLAHAHEKLSALERDARTKLASLEAELAQVRLERDQLAEARQQAIEEMSTLKRAQQDSSNRQSMLESKVQELESLTLPKGASMDGISSHALCNGTSSPPAAPPPPPSLSAPPPAPPKPPAPPAPPPAPGMMPLPSNTDAFTIKRKIDTKYKLPTLNWIALKPNQVRGTVFNELDEEKPRPLIDFDEFEERFRLSGLSLPSSDTDLLASFPSRRKKPDNVSLLEHTRLTNIAISRRKLDIPIEKVIPAINSLDLKQLPLESVELLQRMVPTDAEQKAYKEYLLEKKSINVLTEEDKFLIQLTKVERVSAKLSIMSYMGNFLDKHNQIISQIDTIISSSTSVKSSKKLRDVLEIILAFGNYLNSNKRGPAYGFKLQSLDNLMDTKSTDKRMSLLHYIVSTIRQRFPDLLTFHTELLCINEAAKVSMENLMAEVKELNDGMETVRKEGELRHCPTVKEFLHSATDMLRRTNQKAKLAQDSFKSCVEYFGESSRACDAITFFSLLVRFTKLFEDADKQNETRRRLEMAAQLAQNADTLKAKNQQKKPQDDAIVELRNKTYDEKLLNQNDVYHGVIDDLLTGLKNKPYRRADAVRRSMRRRIDSHRLSRGDDLDV